jgi:hypothetical protein
MLEARKTNPADVMKIHRAYSSTPPPPVYFLHNAALLDMLVDDIFSTASELPAKHADK